MSKLAEEQVIYCREHYKPGDKEYGIRSLAEKMGVSVDTMKALVHGKTYKDIGGTIHPAKERVSSEVKQAIATSSVDVRALAAQYGLSEETVAKFLPKAKGRRSKVTEEVKAAIMAEYKPYSKDYGREALAEKYGLSTATIGNILKEKPPESPGIVIADYLKEAIIEGHDDGLNVPQLMERFSLSRDVVKGVLKEAGIDIRRRRVSEELKQEIIGEFKKGRSLRDLAEAYSINRATISTWVADLKVPKPKKELDDQTREQIYRYHSQGYGTTIIAKTIGISQQIVRKVIDGEM